MTRHEWCARLASAMLQSLPGEAVRVLRRVLHLDTPADPSRTPDLGPSVLAAEIMSRYAAGGHPDDIAAWCDRAEIEIGPGAVNELIVPLCECYRMSRLRFDRWWRPDEAAATLRRTRRCLVTLERD